MRGSMAPSPFSQVIFIFFIILSIFTSQSLSESDGCSPESSYKCRNRAEAFPLKIVGVVSIFVSSILGVCGPLLTKSAPALQPDKNIFVIVKACASGVFLATGFMHVLAESYELLSSSCLDENPWHKFPFTGFVTMLTAILALMVDSMATSIYTKNCTSVENSRTDLVTRDEETSYRVRSENVHGHHSAAITGSHGSQILRYRVIAIVLELGIVVHSMVIGLAFGVSDNICYVRNLLPVLCFHQLFQGVGLGGSILQAEYRVLKEATLVLCFSVITPVGIAVGMALEQIYDENSPASFITVGLLNAASAGILIYMALVDLLAAEFMGSKMQGSISLQMTSYVAVFLGIGGMSLIAKWT